MQRLIRLRSVALAECLRVTRIPRRGGPSSRRPTKNVNPERLLRAPSFSRRSKAALCVSRRSAPSPYRARLVRSSTPRLGLKSQALATPGSARAQHGPAALGSATDQKSVAPCAPRLRWLISALHRCPDPKKGGIRAWGYSHCQLAARDSRRLWITSREECKILAS